MRICIDSNQFIFGLSGSDVASETLLKLLPRLEVVIPRLIIKEVTRNLNQSQVKAFYALLNRAPRVSIVDEPVPIELVRKYVGLGLREKADAVIGAFAEWQGARYIISENRHFLNELQSTVFEVVSPEEFLRLYYWAVMENQ
ncbi:MAG: PIN domain-containing protein [Candidatus Aminicenantes bacterium]|nr:PIN domain-containing protein [Candidatus Aminicenantes bacterium]